jgi:hypothetical protein
MLGTALLWGVFVILFSLMAWREWRAAARGLQVPQYDLGFSDMNKAHEILRQAIVDADRSSHRIAATSYFLAAVVAVASLILAVVE